VRILTISAPPPPDICLNIGVTGHRSGNAAYATNRQAIEDALADVLDAIAAAASAHGAPVRLHSLLTDGVDQLAARSTLARNWELVAPLPFGKALNATINAAPKTVEDAKALLAGNAISDDLTQSRFSAISGLYDHARVFALGERDGLLTRLYLDMLAAPGEIIPAQAYNARSSARVALAGRVMIEQSDIIIGIWDGVSRAFLGGTGHTISEALEHGAPVIWIDAKKPGDWRILHAPEALANLATPIDPDRFDELSELVRTALFADDTDGAETLASEIWRSRSSRWWTAYRRVETLFSGEGKPFRSLRQTYDTPDALVSDGAHSLLTAANAIPDRDAGQVVKIQEGVLRRFAWADGISSWLSDAYRGGMATNFILSALAVVAGISYQPLGITDQKWLFAIGEFLLLAWILTVTWLGGRWRWHKRWFETRRVAEYLRHAPILLTLGVARAPGRWPQGGDVAWPEYYARHALRSIGLPHATISSAYLRNALRDLLDDHVVRQRDYHLDKARRLTAVHHNLDALSNRLFQLAVLSVSTYLLLKGAAAMHLLPHSWPESASKLFTFFGVAFPTFGGAIAGLRYFGDFERFAAISDITAAKLDGVHSRISLLLEAPDESIDYARVSELTHATDDIVVSEIENWQAVFGGKHITVPV
jgi:hypothetical protein